LEAVSPAGGPGPHGLVGEEPAQVGGQLRCGAVPAGPGLLPRLVGGGGVGTPPLPAAAARLGGAAPPPSAGAGGARGGARGRPGRLDLAQGADEVLVAE